MTAQFDLSSVLGPLDEARGLPNAHYTSPTVFEEEKHSVLFKTWAGIGFGKDVPEARDAKPVDFLGMPLLILRDSDNTVRVFQNTCRHRGMILVKEPGKIRGVIRCPYHSWCYDLNGALRTTPHIGGPGQNTHEKVNREDLGLFEVRSFVWQDVVFVNVSGDAEPFETANADLLARWAEFNQPVFHGGDSSSFKLSIATNWKLAVENYCESYHLPWVHPGLNTYSRLEDHYNIEQDDCFSGQGTKVYRQLRADDGNVFCDFEGLGPNWDEGAEYIAVYPNVLFGVHRDHTFAIVLEPVGPEATIEHIEIYYAADPAGMPELAVLRDANAVQWKTVFEEDIFVVEGMQRGRHGGMFDGGRFSPAMDGPTHAFHKWIAKRVASGRSTQPIVNED